MRLSVGLCGVGEQTPVRRSNYLLVRQELRCKPFQSQSIHPCGHRRGPVEAAADCGRRQRGKKYMQREAMGFDGASAGPGVAAGGRLGSRNPDKDPWSGLRWELMSRMPVCGWPPAERPDRESPTGPHATVCGRLWACECRVRGWPRAEGSDREIPTRTLWSGLRWELMSRMRVSGLTAGRRLRSGNPDRTPCNCLRSALAMRMPGRGLTAGSRLGM